MHTVAFFNSGIYIHNCLASDQVQLKLRTKVKTTKMNRYIWYYNNYCFAYSIIKVLSSTDFNITGTVKLIEQVYIEKKYIPIFAL